MNEDILYLISALRDGSIDYRIGKNYEIKIGQKEVRWLSRVLKPIIERNFNVKANIHGNLLRITSKKAVQQLQEISGIKTGGWSTPQYAKELQPSERIPYIRGFWDAEGGCPKQPEKCERAEQSYVSFHQKETEPLLFIRNTLMNLGYKPTNITFCKGAHEFRLTRKSEIKRFHKEIGSWHPEKGKRLERLAEKLS